MTARESRSHHCHLQAVTPGGVGSGGVLLSKSYFSAFLPGMGNSAVPAALTRAGCLCDTSQPPVVLQCQEQAAEKKALPKTCLQSSGNGWAESCGLLLALLSIGVRRRFLHSMCFAALSSSVQ